MILFAQIFTFIYLIVGLACPAFLLLSAYLSKDPVLNYMSKRYIIKKILVWLLFWPIIMVLDK